MKTPEDSLEAKSTLHSFLEHTDEERSRPEFLIVRQNLSKCEAKVLSPLIFTRRQPPSRHTPPPNPRLAVFESILDLVAQTYYGMGPAVGEPRRRAPRTRTQGGRLKATRSGERRGARSKVEIDAPEPEKALVNGRNALDYLISPLKNDLPFELWTLKEIAIFEASICLFGKKFDLIQTFVATKNLDETVKFYNMWKMTSHYKIWSTEVKALSKKQPRIWH